MSTLRNLHDAFETLEHRADLAPTSPIQIATARPQRRRVRRWLAPTAAAGAVAAVAGVTLAVAVSHHARSGGTATQQAAHRPAATVTTPQATRPASRRFQPPTTAAELAATTRAILAGTATITVTDGQSLVALTAPPAPAATMPAGAGASAPMPTASRPNASAGGSPNGAAIVGTLTASGRSGGFDLNVWLATPGTKAMCDGDTQCTVQHLPGGSTLAVGTWHDPARPGGITYQVELVRPDGAGILLHLSNESSPKGDSTVTAPQVPLTRDQMIALVTSDRW